MQEMQQFRRRASAGIQPTPTIPITFPKHNPSWGIRGASIGIQPTPRTPNPRLQYFIGWAQSTSTGYHPYQFLDPRWCNPNFWEYQPGIADNNSWQLWYQGESTPIQQQGRMRPVQPPGKEQVQPRTTESVPLSYCQERIYPLPEISKEDDKSPKSLMAHKGGMHHRVQRHCTRITS